MESVCYLRYSFLYCGLIINVVKNVMQSAKNNSNQNKKPAKKMDGVVISHFPGYFLIACIVISGGYLLHIYTPFITVLILAAILGTAFYPLYQKILVIVRNREVIASLIACLLIVILIIVPLFIFIVLLGRQAFDVYVFIVDQLRNGAFDHIIKWSEGGLLYDSLSFVKEHVQGLIDFESIDLKTSIADSAQAVTSWLAAQSANLLKSFVWLAISFFVLVFSLFYIFKDGDKIIERIMTLSPLPREHEEGLFNKFKEMSHATLYGIFFTAVVQGILGGIGFAIAGIPNALFWGTAVAVFSLVPVIGTGTIWLPAAIILLVGQNWFGGIFLLVYGAGVISTVDNFLRAYLIGERTKTNQLLMFLAVFGGIGAFGLIGVIFGPLILTLFFAFVHIYETEYDKVLHRK